MAYELTPNLGIQKPVIGTNQAFETSVINANWDKVDSIYDFVVEVQADGLAQVDAFNITANAALASFNTSSNAALASFNTSLNTFESAYEASLASLDTYAIIEALGVVDLNVNGGSA